MDFPKNREEFAFFENCNSVVLVSDDTPTAKVKNERTLKAVQIIDSYSEYSIQPRFAMIKNKVLGKASDRDEIRVIGEIPMYEACAPAQMARQLALSNVFDQLV